MTYLTPAFVAVGALFIGLAVPLLRRRVRPNLWYGLRVPATFADEWVWYEANARTARDMIALGAAQIVLALLLPLLPGLSETAYATANVGAMALGGLAMAIVGWVRANRLLRQRRAEN